MNDIIEDHMNKFVFDGTVNRDLSIVAQEVERLHDNEVNGYPCRAVECDRIYKSHAWRVR